MEMTVILVLLLGLLGCLAGLPEVEISTGRRLYKGYQVWTMDIEGGFKEN